jgi:hypothetical protein
MRNDLNSEMKKKSLKFIRVLEKDFKQRHYSKITFCSFPIIKDYALDIIASYRLRRISQTMLTMKHRQRQENISLT